jgi:GT2 family glycosyltransferase
MKTTSILLVTRGDAGWDRYVPDLQQQSQPPDQFITVIDRTTSEAERQALAARHPSLTFVFNDENIGLTKSLNRGLAVATGEVILRTDDDDKSRGDRIEKQLALMAASGADLVCSWAEGVMEGETAPPWIIDCPTDDAGLKRALLRRNVIVHASLAFRRDAIAALGGYDETFRYAQDYGLYLAAIRAGLTFAAISEPLVRRAYAADSITVSRRYHQMMFSAAARIVHSAHTGNVNDFLRVVARYAVLAATPPFLRRWRRRLFQLMGRGA